MWDIEEQTDSKWSNKCLLNLKEVTGDDWWLQAVIFKLWPHQQFSPPCPGFSASVRLPELLIDGIQDWRQFSSEPLAAILNADFPSLLYTETNPFSLCRCELRFERRGRSRSGQRWKNEAWINSQKPLEIFQKCGRHFRPQQASTPSSHSSPKWLHICAPHMLSPCVCKWACVLGKDR